ncbi:MAG TPA: CDP-diacylglycerol--serine O-phosphatidyltransferase [Porphyromonadaceae bacterium]|jgi:CDP-diacylglycerol--serine O-phosphatidyltransferase|nr:CDP-diacylglycerol--serine O-phosphatidyltransferase [Porphyromonadaceae bacterium]HBK32766.1 CDP-diacylglycerol--serine O-phosphatidyltransferase [Porphyromonadaceae bacterium]HCM22217.1 CDP-diacylglycerol--serine O-phosphatidyltransferase [Porphyromonadaceae bacterium]
MKHLPNILTLSNLFSGCIATVMAFQGDFKAVVIWVIVAAVFDFFDGFAARLLHAPSAIGKELDSLADVISFGLAPASAVFVLLRDFTLYPAFVAPLETIIPYAAFLIPVFSALRLAKFNIDERQTTGFIGLPTPANGLFWISYCFGVQPLAYLHPSLFYSTIGFILVLSLLMVAEIPMFSLKVKKLRLKGNERQVLLIVLTIAFVALWGIIGIAWGMLAYIAISLMTQSYRPENR